MMDARLERVKIERSRSHLSYLETLLRCLRTVCLIATISGYAKLVVDIFFI